jgi:hypothetical protein
MPARCGVLEKAAPLNEISRKILSQLHVMAA